MPPAMLDLTGDDDDPSSPPLPSPKMPAAGASVAVFVVAACRCGKLSLRPSSAQPDAQVGTLSMMLSAVSCQARQGVPLDARSSGCITALRTRGKR